MLKKIEQIGRKVYYYYNLIEDTILFIWIIFKYNNIKKKNFNFVKYFFLFLRIRRIGFLYHQ